MAFLFVDSHNTKKTVSDSSDEEDGNYSNASSSCNKQKGDMGSTKRKTRRDSAKTKSKTVGVIAI